MRNTFAGLSLALAFAHCAYAAGVEEAIEAGYAAVRALQPMRSGAVYSVPVESVTESGPGDQFLRRRTASEINESKLSCGCGGGCHSLKRAHDGARPRRAEGEFRSRSVACHLEFSR